MRPFYVLLAAVALQSCSLTARHTSPLYDRLGGETGVRLIVEQLVTDASKDRRIKHLFSSVTEDPYRFESLKVHLENYLCQTAGGPCEYGGRDLKSAHAGMGISNTHFNVFMEHLVHALESQHVTPADKEGLLGLLGPLRHDIVENRN